MLVPSIDNIRGPFERVETPNEAVDRLVRLYDEATQALHGAVERFLKDGEPPSAATRALFRYPELRLTYAPDGAGAFERARIRQIQRGGRLHDDGHPARGLSRLSARAARAARHGIRGHDRGRRRRAGDSLPVCDRKRRRADARRRRRRRGARTILSRAFAGDDWRRDRGRRVRLRPRAAARPVRRAARRLLAPPSRALYRLRLAGDAALGAAHQLPPLCRPVRAMGLEAVACGTGVEKVILPGNLVIDSSISPAEAEARVARRLASLPDARLSLRARRRARDQSGQHRRRALERQDDHRPYRGLAAALLADGRPLRRACGSRR